MDYNIIISYKTKYTKLDSKILKKIKKQISSSNIYYKYKKPKNVYISKNDINILLNKLCLSNIDNILIDFFNNIKINENNINSFIKIIYNKILNEKSFVKANSIFLVKTFNIIYNKYSINLTNIIINYITNEFNNNYLSYDENKKENFLNFIKELIEQNMLIETIYNDIITYLLNKKLYIDIYFLLKNTNRVKKYNNIINNIINNNNNIRLQTLFKSLTTKKKSKKKSIKKKISKKTNYDLEIENIIEEYLFLKDISEIKLYLKENNNISNFINILKNKIKNNNNKDLKLLLNKIRI